MEWTKKLARQVRETRIANGLSQAELAKRLKVAPATISNWENHQRQTPSVEQIEKLDEILGLSESDGNESDSSAFGTWLNKARLEKEMTMRELSTKSKISPPQLYNIEAGRSTPRKTTMDRIFNALGMRPDAEILSSTKAAIQIKDVGELLDFDPHSDIDLPTDAGIYVFYDISNRPLYVGESGNIAKRVKEHSDKFWFRRPMVQSGSYIVIQDVKLRQKVERVLIGFLKTNAVLNKEHVRREG